MVACATTSPAPRSSETRADAMPLPAPSVPDTRALLINSATSMLGQPYRFGGDSPGGFDCSGLVVFAAAGAGLRVPRTAAEQLQFGVPVARAEIQAGDLIFMHLTGKDLHVAIALDGRQFVHAPSSGGNVRIDSLEAAPYSRGFIGARRIVPAAASTLSFAAPN
jgi:cell wall-associated NlpC family hydrolase